MELAEWEHEKRHDFITQEKMNSKEKSTKNNESNLHARVFHLKIGEKRIASWEALKDHTREDPEMSDLYRHLQNPLKFPLQKEETKKKKKSFELDIQQGILLYKKDVNRKTIENDEFWRIYIPSTMRRTAMALVHCMPTGAHMGRDRMKKLMKEKFFWKGMDTDIGQCVQCCHSCQISKTPKPLKPGILTEFPLMPEPWDTIHIDHVGPLPKTKEGYNYILTLIDRGTNFVMAVPVKDVRAVTQARILYEEIFCKF